MKSGGCKIISLVRHFLPFMKSNRRCSRARGGGKIPTHCGCGGGGGRAAKPKRCCHLLADGGSVRASGGERGRFRRGSAGDGFPVLLMNSGERKHLRRGWIGELSRSEHSVLFCSVPLSSVLFLLQAAIKNERQNQNKQPPPPLLQFPLCPPDVLMWTEIQHTSSADLPK